MEQGDLIKKLKNIELPEIEVISHKTRLRLALLNSGCFNPAPFGISLRKCIFFAGPTLALFLIFSTTVIVPKIINAKALNIAKNSTEIKKLMDENNMILGEIKIKDGNAYVLLSQPTKENRLEEGVRIQKTPENNQTDVGGAIVEIDLKKKEIKKVNSIKSDDVNPLNEKEKSSAENIAQSNEIIKDIIPKEAKIEEIKSSFPQKIRLEKEGNNIKAVSQDKDDKKARIKYILDGKKWVVSVDLNNKRVEEIQYSLQGSENE